ncbi:MAG: hypothetical protein JXR48_04095 [Candidatus Delongbacteria bacterium]|nr:hypothetical protein [Candidatus Delongbacteria bacterium]MBN2834127.1 hypothetical protein [Candidatus Delongbacteria bacterium]
MIEIQNLTKSVKGQNIEIDKLKFSNGETVMLTGHLNSCFEILSAILCGRIKKDAGVIQITGFESGDFQSLEDSGYFDLDSYRIPHTNVKNMIWNVAKLKKINENILSSRIVWFENYFPLKQYFSKTPEKCSATTYSIIDLFLATLIRPGLIVYRDPFSLLPFELHKKFVMLLNWLKENGSVNIITTTDPQRYKNLTDRMLVMRKGRIVFDGHYENYDWQELSNGV